MYKTEVGIDSYDGHHPFSKEFFPDLTVRTKYMDKNNGRDRVDKRV